MNMANRINMRLPFLLLMGTSLLAMAMPAWAQPVQPGAGELPVAKPQPIAPSTGTVVELTRESVAEPRLPPPLPPEAQEVLSRYRQQQIAALREVIQQLQAVLQNQRNGYTSPSAALRARIQQLQQQLTAMEGPGGNAPPSITELRGRDGQSLTFAVVGDSGAGTIWGGDFNVYTDDSPLAVAAVHAGVLKNGEHGSVRITILPGRDSYPAIARNGIESQAYNHWDGSYRIETVAREPARVNPPVRFEIAPPPRLPSSSVVPQPGAAPAPAPGNEVGNGINLSQFRGQNNATVIVQVTGDTTGTVWGSDIYTDDSSISTAAVHAGILKSGEKGFVKVKILPGRDSYTGCERNGVTTQNYGHWDGSFSLEKAAGLQPGVGGVLDLGAGEAKEANKIHIYTRGLEDK